MAKYITIPEKFHPILTSGFGEQAQGNIVVLIKTKGIVSTWDTTKELTCLMTK